MSQYLERRHYPTTTALNGTMSESFGPKVPLDNSDIQLTEPAHGAEYQAGEVVTLSGAGMASGTKARWNEDGTLTIFETGPTGNRKARRAAKSKCR